MTGLKISAGHMTALVTKPAEVILNPVAFKKSGVKVNREMTAALNSIQAIPTIQIDVPASLILRKKPTDCGDVFCFTCGAGVKNKVNNTSATTGSPVLSQTLARQPSLSPSRDKKFNERMVPRGIPVLNTPIAMPNSRPANH